MGATNFIVEKSGTSAKAVFDELQEAARRAYGSEGYTGSIAEKAGFEEFTLPSGLDIQTFLNYIEGDEDASLDGMSPAAADVCRRARRRYDDKWGPAVCVQTMPVRSGRGAWLFCGMASE